ncbi:hypothetical protein MPSEU_000085000 [Mayamaea pseudoterrestris]|nr:hypothetical protein MPSEU_000085000 [Mayamaea pseudoterrestris]
MGRSSDQAIQDALDALHLPQMPQEGDHSSHVLRILVVADLDLPSASALAEYSLQQNNFSIDASMVDLCIACGSFARNEDLMPYLRGKQACLQLCRQQEVPGVRATTPFFRSREDTAALEGIMTAALSQLESIVCRVVYCPGSQDPVTTLFADRSRWLTPNSRNIHQQWLPLAPGIGCAALLYLDSAETAVKNASSFQPTKTTFDSDHDDASEGNEGEDAVRQTWSDKWLQIHRNMCAIGYSRSVEDLIQLAPPPNHPIPFTHPASQTILVTHYVDCSFESFVGTNGRSQDDKDSHHVSQPLTTQMHASFLDCADLAPNPLCLEIASGSAAEHAPELIRKGDNQVLRPGSLRERGEFCILEVALLENGPETLNGSTKEHHEDIVCPSSKRPSSSKTTKHQRTFAWKVQKVDFHRLGRARDRI